MLCLLPPAEVGELLSSFDKDGPLSLCLQSVNWTSINGNFAIFLLDDGTFCMPPEHHALNHLARLKSTAENLTNSDIVHIELSLFVGQDTDACFCDQLGDEVFVTILLGHHGCPDGFHHRLFVPGVLHFKTAKSLQNLQSFLQSHFVTLSYFSWLQTHPYQFFRSSQQGTSKDDDKICGISNLILLHL